MIKYAQFINLNSEMKDVLYKKKLENDLVKILIILF